MSGAGATAEVTLALLAGGAGSRMGMRKDAVRVGRAGHALVEWTLRRLRWRGPTMLVGPVDGRSVEGEGLVDVVVRDAVAGEGPLRGIATALARCGTTQMVVVPIDMPGLGAREVDWVVARANELPEALAVMLRRMSGGEAVVEPFPMLCRTGFEEAVVRRLREGKRSLRGLVEEPGVRVLDAPAEWEERVWSNLNRVEDVEAFARGLE